MSVLVQMIDVGHMDGHQSLLSTVYYTTHHAAVNVIIGCPTCTLAGVLIRESPTSVTSRLGLCYSRFSSSLKADIRSSKSTS